MYAFGATLEAVSAAIPTAQLVFDPTPLAYVGLVVLAAMVGSLLGIAMRTQRTVIDRKSEIGAAIPHPA